MINEIIENKVYKIRNCGTGRMLNLYGGITTNGTNVCQYSDDGSNEQKWVRIGSKLYTYGSTTKCLDRYNSSTSAKHNNADIWSNTDNANQNLNFGSSNGFLTIKLNGTNLYLSAYSDPSTDSYINKNGNKDECKTVTSAGNIYWGTALNNYSRWEAIDISEADSEIVVSGMPAINAYRDSGYKEYFHPGSGMKTASWAANGGGTIDNIIKAFYKDVYGVDPASQSYYLYSLYGSKTNAKGSKFNKTFHHGVDIHLSPGHAVKTAHSGELIRASGNTVAIYDADKNVTYLYLHCNISNGLQIGMHITKGTKIGTESNVGLGYSDNTTNSHVHIEVRVGRDSTPEMPSASTSVPLPTLNPYNYL